MAAHTVVLSIDKAVGRFIALRQKSIWLSLLC